MTDDENLFSRWSRRKRRVAEAESSEAAPEESGKVAEPETDEPETPEEEAELLRQLGLPLPEAMQAGDDFSMFMKAGVPEFLRRRALRVLWKSNPVLANLDGLNDYDEDFTSPDLTKKVLSTAYKVGRGILSEPGAKQPGERDEAPARDAVESENQPQDEVLAHAENGLPESDAASKPPAADDKAEAESTARPRRMRFKT